MAVGSSNNETLKKVWEDLADLRDALELYIRKSNPDVYELRFRGYNPSSSYSQWLSTREVELWLNTEALLQPEIPIELLVFENIVREIWDQLISEFGENLDHVVLSPESQGFRRIGISLVSVKNNYIARLFLDEE